jgi:hypothetical protein
LQPLSMSRMAAFAGTRNKFVRFMRLLARW